MQETVRCNICGSPEFLTMYEARPEGIGVAGESYKVTDHSCESTVTVVKCKKCGLCYVNPMLNKDVLADSYMHMVDEEYVREEQGRRASSAPILEYMRKLGKSGHLLDIGCAAGFFLDEARKKGWEIYGLELSEWAVAYGKEKLKLDNLRQGTLVRGMYPDSYFDVIVMQDTIEHLIDPKAQLAEMRRILKADGVICVTTPDIDSLLSRILRAKWWGIKRFHLYYFSRATLCGMLSATGFGPIKIKSYARAFTWHYWVDCLAGYNKRLYVFFRLVFPEWLFGKGLFWLNLGDQIEVYAKKDLSIKESTTGV